MLIRKVFLIQGIVQGVGFRPFIYRLSLENSLVGFVKNGINGVELEVEGRAENIVLFEKQLHSKLPLLARIDKIESSYKELLHGKTFEIVQSSDDFTHSKTALISPDIATCDECLEDIKKVGKYHNYFATNCTNCGPRYSIIKTVPMIGNRLPCKSLSCVNPVKKSIQIRSTEDTMHSQSLVIIVDRVCG